MIKLVAFDWNGTLLADVTAVVDTENIVYKQFKMKPLTISRFRDTFDVPFMDYYVANGLPREQYLKYKDRIEEIFHPAYEVRATRCRTRSGTRQVLSWLHKNKIDNTIFSNHTLDGINFQLKRLGIKKYFHEILARKDIIKESPKEGRNKGARLEDYLQRHKFKKSEAVIVGDTIEEIDIARTLDIPSVAITGGYCSTARLKEAKPDFLIHNMVDLEKIIRKMNGTKR